MGKLGDLYQLVYEFSAASKTGRKPTVRRRGLMNAESVNIDERRNN